SNWSGRIGMPGSLRAISSAALMRGAASDLMHQFSTFVAFAKRCFSSLVVLTGRPQFLRDFRNLLVRPPRQGRDGFLHPARHRRCIVQPPTLAVPHQPLMPGVTVAQVGAMALDQAFAVANVGQVHLLICWATACRTVSDGPVLPRVVDPLAAFDRLV